MLFSAHGGQKEDVGSPGTGVNGQLLAAMCVLGIESCFAARAVSALNLRGISPAPIL